LSSPLELPRILRFRLDSLVRAAFLAGWLRDGELSCLEDALVAGTAPCDSAAAAAVLVAEVRLLAAGATFPTGRSAGHFTSPSELDGDEADEEEDEDTGSEDRRRLALELAAGALEARVVWRERLGGASELSEESIGDVGPLLVLFDALRCCSPHNFTVVELIRV